MKTYKGPITQLEANQIFVFGSNTQGRHGKGSALWALNHARAILGQPMGRQGRSFAIITKDLTKSKHPSVDQGLIISQIYNLYTYAIIHSELDFLIAYSGNGTNLNGYTPQEMADMFNQLPIPSNIVFEEEFSKLLTVQPKKSCPIQENK